MEPLGVCLVGLTHYTNNTIRVEDSQMADEGKAQTTPTEPTIKHRPGFIVLAMGVLLPLVTLGVELTTRMCTAAIFDPLPTILHIFLVAFVPFANFYLWRALRRRADASPRYAHFNSLAMGIALFYSLVFLPMVPIGAAAVVYFGIGLLPLTPLISLLAAIRLRILLSRSARDAGIRVPLWPGLTAGVLVLLALELPTTLTRIGMEMATSAEHEMRLNGVHWLRAIGSEEVLLKYCYPRSGRGTDMIGAFFTDQISVWEAQELYYRVTGTAFNSLPVPAANHSSGGWYFGNDWDPGLGSERVGGRSRELSLASSRMDGSVDANAAVAYLEWTMVFRNEGKIQKEARSQIGLPPGAVISRVTLWINGEEREAAFAGRGQAREAYENVVRQSRDPVLVTSAGKDRISMQLFPVPPSGEMKVRLGITIPMRLENRQASLMALPYFHERNFELAPSLRHALWVESKSPLRNDSTTGTAITNGFALRAELEDPRLHEAASVIMVERNESRTAWAADPRSGHRVVQHLVEQVAKPPKRLVVVVDGSVSMDNAVPQLAATLASLPNDIEVALIIAGETANEQRKERGDAATALAEKIEDFRYVGGEDNVSELTRGLDLLTGPEDALLWIHGPQPVSLEPVEPLIQRLERLPFRPVWYEVQVQPGSNHVGEKLEGLHFPIMLAGDELQRLIDDWRSGASRLVAQRERIAAGVGSLAITDKTSDHLVRLWAADEIERLVRSRIGKRRDEAVRLAQTYQLVTSVSGAVVLETQEQYDRAGLNPVDAGTVPSVPEPEVWAMLIIAFMILVHTYLRRRIGDGSRVVA